MDTNTTPTAGPAYPIPRPEGGDDPRFRFGLMLDVGEVLHQHGYPPVHTGADLLRLQQALFTLIYQEQPQ